MTSDQIGGIIRTILAAIGGVIVGKGWIDNETMLAISGAIATIVVGGWSWWTNRASKVVDPATAKPKDPVGAAQTKAAVTGTP